MKTPPLPSIERRWTPGKVELRQDGDKPPVIAGHGAVFEKRSENMGYGDVKFFEVIERNAFDDVLSDDVRGLFNHDSNLILGRTASKTMRLNQDAAGLAYEIQADKRQSYVSDLLISLERGDVNQSSFAFSLGRDGQRWVEEGDTIIRYIKKVSRLFDVSPVVYPAYPDAPSSLRDMRAMIEEARREGMLGKDAAEALAHAATARRARELALAEIDA